MSATADHARAALEEVCARGDLARARELYAEDFVDHVNALDFHGQEGIAKSVALYHAVFPDLRIQVEDQTTDGDRITSRWTLHGTHKGRTRHAPRHHHQPLRGRQDRRGLDRLGQPRAAPPARAAPRPRPRRAPPRGPAVSGVAAAYDRHVGTGEGRVVAQDRHFEAASASVDLRISPQPLVAEVRARAGADLQDAT